MKECIFVLAWIYLDFDWTFTDLLCAHVGRQWLGELLHRCPSKLQHFPLKQKKKTSQKSMKMSQKARFLLWPSLSVFPWKQSLLSWKRAAKKTQTELIKEDQAAWDLLIFLILKHDC